MSDPRALAHARGAMKIAEVVSSFHYLVISNLMNCFYYSNLVLIQSMAVVCLVVFRHYNLSFGGDDNAAADRYIGKFKAPLKHVERFVLKFKFDFSRNGHFWRNASRIRYLDIIDKFLLGKNESFSLFS